MKVHYILDLEYSDVDYAIRTTSPSLLRWLIPELLKHFPKLRVEQLDSALGREYMHGAYISGIPGGAGHDLHWFVMSQIGHAGWEPFAVRGPSQWYSFRKAEELEG